MDETFKKYACIAIAVILLVCAVYWYGSRDHDSGAGQTRSDIRAVGEQQSRADQEIRESQRLVETVRESNQSAIREIEASRSLSTDSAGLIRIGKQIVSNIRERAKSKDK